MQRGETENNIGKKAQAEQKKCFQVRCLFTCSLSCCSVANPVLSAEWYESDELLKICIYMHAFI